MNRSTWMTVLVSAALLTTAMPAAAQRRDRDGRSDRPRRRDNRDDRGVEQPVVQPTTGAASGTMEDAYSVLLRRSIFAKGGVASGWRPTTSTGPAPKPLSPEQQVVFYGVLAQDDQFVAFAENHSTGAILLLRQGDPVARGRVEQITLDTLSYIANGKVTEVRIGQNLSGESVAVAASSPSTQTSAPSAASTAGMSDRQKEILEQMRKRRAAQGAQ